MAIGTNHIRLKRLLFIPLVLLLCGHVYGTTVHHSVAVNSSSEISEETLTDQLRLATASINSLFNTKEGIFLWNIQNPDNLTRFGEYGDLTNAQEVLEKQGYTYWAEGIAQDLAIQYLLLKNNIYHSAQLVGSLETEREFTRNWVFMTEKIVSWIYFNIATNDNLIVALSELSETGDGFGEFYNILLREKEHLFINSEISLLLDTLEIGSKILKSVEFLPYFNQREQNNLLLLAELASNWWEAINRYILYDPAFAIAGLGRSKIHLLTDKWIGWKNFIQLTRNGSMQLADIRENNYLEFQNYLYTSPQIAHLYLTHLEKLAVEESYLWDPRNIYIDKKITDPLMIEIISEITNNYANHIKIVRNKTTYVFTPALQQSWIPLPELFSGYSYQWEEYFIDSQGLTTDLYQYRYAGFPLSITGLRTFQGAGDIRGLMDIYRVLRHGFKFDHIIQDYEKAAFALLEEILRAQREDGSFVFSPYFGTSLPKDLFPAPLFNNAKIEFPEMLPEGLNEFTGTLAVFDFLLGTYKDLNKFSLDRFSFLINRQNRALQAIADLLFANIDEETKGLLKQAVIGSSFLRSSLPIFEVFNVKLEIDLRFVNIPLNNLPNWIIDFNPFDMTASSNIFQWDYLRFFYKLYQIFEEEEYLIPLVSAFQLFNEDYQEDQQYQILAICGVKDAVANIFFREKMAGGQMKLCDNTGHYGDAIPYGYRQGVSPVTHVFASVIPQDISAMLLSIPEFQPLIELDFYDPINQIVLCGLFGGILLSVIVIYLRRPKHQ
ncbi:MAG: hypothetical protein GF308_13615 [Candidatus Heimdallarchaeota archaeon]|nr:hypothetical protein [Candidatus Heimdallarchaeota archaeon]